MSIFTACQWWCGNVIFSLISICLFTEGSPCDDYPWWIGPPAPVLAPSIPGHQTWDPHPSSSPTPLDIRHWTPQPWHLGAITGDLFKLVHLRTIRIIQSLPCPHGHQTRIPWHRPLLVTTGGDYSRPVWTCSLDNPTPRTDISWLKHVWLQNRQYKSDWKVFFVCCCWHHNWVQNQLHGDIEIMNMKPLPLKCEWALFTQNINRHTCFWPGKVDISLSEVHFQLVAFFSKVNFDRDGCVTSCVLVSEMWQGSKFA